MIFVKLIECFQPYAFLLININLTVKFEIGKSMFWTYSPEGQTDGHA